MVHAGHLRQSKSKNSSGDLDAQIAECLPPRTYGVFQPMWVFFREPIPAAKVVNQCQWSRWRMETTRERGTAVATAVATAQNRRSSWRLQSGTFSWPTLLPWQWYQTRNWESYLLLFHDPSISSFSRRSSIRPSESLFLLLLMRSCSKVSRIFFCFFRIPRTHELSNNCKSCGRNPLCFGASMLFLASFIEVVFRDSLAGGLKGAIRDIFEAAFCSWICLVCCESRPLCNHFACTEGKCASPYRVSHPPSFSPQIVVVEWKFSEHRRFHHCNVHYRVTSMH